MLDRLRTHVKGWLGMVILVLISIPFALFGLQNYTTGGSEAPVAEIGDYKIYQADVNNAFQQRMGELKQQYGEQFSPKLFNEEAVRNEALNRLVQERLILYTVNEDGYAVSEKSILEVISTLDVFQKDGRFDKDSYTQLLRAKGLTTNEFVQQVKTGLERDQFISAIVETTLVDESEISDFYRLNNQTRDIRYLSLALSSVIDKVDVTDDELNEHYAQNEHLYKVPAQASIEYVELSLNNLMSGLKPSEAELLEFYENEAASFTELGRRRASHILFEVPDGASEAEAENKRARAASVMAKISAGDDFAELAKEFSDDIGSAKSGGDIGIITDGLLDVSLEKAIASLKVGETSDIIQTSYGFQIIKLTENEPAKTKPYETVKANVEKQLKRKIALDMFYQHAERFAELGFENPSSLNPLVEELNLSIQQQATFSEEKGEGIASFDKVRQATFNEDVLAGNNSDALELGPEQLVILRIKEHKPEQVQPLVEVRGVVGLSVKTDKAIRLLRSKADETLAKINAGQTLNDIGRVEGISIVDIGPVTRNDSNVPAELLRDAFSMAHPTEGKPTLKQVVLNNGDVAIIELSKITDGDHADITEASRDSFKKFLAQLSGEVTLAASLANLSVDANVVFAKKSE
ncbi:MAG: SurA N-terminal domain-containing protein [Cycloclasticus sp.]|nr:SurA N-terminal domain-containing protein [Cycloclasticus sp.]